MVKTKIEKRIILSDTSLCAIVRDEMINPAQLAGKSGIRSFVESHVPYVERAVIVDTGSVDGTREELEQLQSEFRNLRVYDRPFDNYVKARNDSLKRVKTKWAFILDVDELFTQASFEATAPLIKERGNRFVRLEIREVGFNNHIIGSEGHHIRLFENRGVRFAGSGIGCWEYLTYICEPKRPRGYSLVNAHVPGACSPSSNYGILHFMPGDYSGPDAILKSFPKHRFWYNRPDKFHEPPSLREGFKQWKQPNPHRDEYK